MTADPIDIALRVAHVLETHDIRYVVGGSLASSMSGEPRSTLDVDLVVELSEENIEAVVAALGKDFYSDTEALRRAVRDKSSANLIHLATSIKVDLFVMGGSPADGEQMDRRQHVQVAADPDRFLYVYTPEDILLQKLRWYRMGGETSDRQWRDILGIVLVQGDRLDLTYVRRSAEHLEVSELLERALAASVERP
ncbi:MAG: hypothetical protein OEM62_04905 [Acidobacteriota bacterium]|nr:hypothetical protein [Acidobacteriota bacterium]